MACSMESLRCCLQRLLCRDHAILNLLLTQSCLQCVSMARGKGAMITCSASVIDLLPALSDQAACDEAETLWDKLDEIDMFTSGHSSEVPSMTVALPLLMTAMQEGRLTEEELVARIHTNPAALFAITPAEDTYIEVEVTNPGKPIVAVAGVPAQFVGRPCGARISRVVVRGTMTLLDSEQLVAAPAERFEYPYHDQASKPGKTVIAPLVSADGGVLRSAHAGRPTTPASAPRSVGSPNRRTRRSSLRDADGNLPRVGTGGDDAVHSVPVNRLTGRHVRFASAPRTF